MTDYCARCDARIVWATSRKTGKRYPANFHSWRGDMFGVERIYLDGPHRCQITEDLVARKFDEATAENAARSAGAAVPNGERCALTGTVQEVTVVKDAFGPTTGKMWVLTDDGCRVEVTVPSAFIGFGRSTLSWGDRVTVTATWTRSRKTPLLGWGKRPVVTLLEAAK